MESEDDLWPPWSPWSAHGRGGPRGHPGRGQDGLGRAGGPGGPADQRGRGGPGQGGPGQGGEWPAGAGRGGSPRGRARQAPALSRAEIVDAAIAVADAEGPAAVSMRRIAQVLRAGTMSLYWHVENKEHLLDLMLDALVAEVEVPPPSGDWRADLRAYALSNRAALLRHGWLIDFIGARPSFGPNTLRLVDRSLALLDGLGLDAALAMTVLQTVNTYVSGAVVREFQELRVQREQEQSRIDERDVRAGFTDWVARLREAGDFGHFVRAFEQGIDPDAAQTRDERFEFGLDSLLDGLAVRVGRLDPHPDGNGPPRRGETGK
jgi:AcrR family transcriptional regulator